MAIAYSHPAQCVRSVSSILLKTQPGAQTHVRRYPCPPLHTGVYPSPEKQISKHQIALRCATRRVAQFNVTHRITQRSVATARNPAWRDRGAPYTRHRLNGYLAQWVPSPPGKHTFKNFTIQTNPETACRKKTRYRLGEVPV